MESAKNFCDTSGNMSEEELIVVIEQQDESIPEYSEGEQRVLEKRCREDSTEDEEGYTTVQRASKRRAKSESINYGENMEFRVCIISKELLPKHFGMAKLLRSEKIKGISTIVYKNPYKAIISFENRECGKMLIECEKLISLGYRMQPADEISLSYGIVRQVDLEETDEEILKNIESEFEIVSVRRLRRLTNMGVWVNSETIRLAFKSPTIPAFVFGFGCRFKVEKYTFPVTQCSGCWLYGHQVRSCPSNKIICPKCGGKHENCETINFRCVNCKGQHMAMYKKCPTFLKEKEIRETMTDKNCTYREALKIFSDKVKAQNSDAENIVTSGDEDGNTQKHNKVLPQNYRSYRDVVVEAEIHRNLDTVEDDDMIESQGKAEGNRATHAKTEQRAKKKIEKQLHQQQSSWLEEDTLEENTTQIVEDDVKKKGYEKSFYRQLLNLFKNIMIICKSVNSMETKLELIGKLLVKEIWQVIIDFVESGAVCKNIFSSLFNG